MSQLQLEPDQKRISKSNSESSNKSTKSNKNFPSLPGTTTISNRSQSSAVTGGNKNKLKKEPTPEAISFYGVRNFDLFQESTLKGLASGMTYPTFNTGSGVVKVRVA